LPLIAFTRVGTPDTATAGAATDLDLVLDCDTATAGVQSACVSTPGTSRDVAIIVVNNSASTVRLGQLDVTVVNPNITRLMAPIITGSQFDMNPDADPAISGPNWACVPNNDKATDSNPMTQQSTIYCLNGAGDGPDIAPGANQAIAIVHYTVPMMASPGMVAVSFEDSYIGDETFGELGSCPTISTPMTCTGATIHVPAVTMALDCNMAQTGIQSKCYISNLTTLRQMDVVVRNNSMTMLRLGFVEARVFNPDTSLLFAPFVDNPGTLNDNPDVHPNLTPSYDWECPGPNNPINDIDGMSNTTQTAYFSCLNAANSGPMIPAMGNLAAMTVRYNIPPDTEPGSLMLTLNNASVADGTQTVTGTCDPVVGLAMLCQPAEVILYCPIDQADTVPDGRVNSGDIGKIASKFGQIPAPANEDQNFDGMINSGDLGLAASVFNQYVTACP
jgi:hypothetical protein